MLLPRQALGCGLLTGCTCMLIDPNNAKTASGVIPIALAFLVYGIIMCVGVQTGAPINFAIDVSGRLFAALVGYKSVHREYVLVSVPIVANVCHCLLAFNI